MISSNYVRPFNVALTVKAAVSFILLSRISSAQSEQAFFKNTNSDMRTVSSIARLALTERSLQAQASIQSIAALNNGAGFIVLDKSGNAYLQGIDNSLQNLNLTGKDGQHLTAEIVLPNNAKNSSPVFAIQTATSEIHIFEIKDESAIWVGSQLPNNCFNTSEKIQNIGFILNQNINCIGGITENDERVIFNCQDNAKSEVQADVSEIKTPSRTVNTFYMSGEKPKLVYANYYRDKTNIGEFELPDSIGSSLYSASSDISTCFNEWDYLDQYSIQSETPYAGRIAQNQDRIFGVANTNSSGIIHLNWSTSNTDKLVSVDSINTVFTSTENAIYMYDMDEKDLYQVGKNNLPERMPIDLGANKLLSVTEKADEVYVSNGSKVVKFVDITVAPTASPTAAPTAMPTLSLN